MTQQSLITRLKAVEEALEEAQAYIAVSIHKGSTSLISTSSAQEDFDQSEAALSDLRELIKEAEGQVVAAFMRKKIPICGGEVVNLSVDQDDLQGDETTCDDFPLYTALGEKP